MELARRPRSVLPSAAAEPSVRIHHYQPVPDGISVQRGRSPTRAAPFFADPCEIRGTGFGRPAFANQKPLKTTKNMPTDFPPGHLTRRLHREIARAIGRQVRAWYQLTVDEGVPPRFNQLLKALDRTEGQTASSAGAPASTGVDADGLASTMKDDPPVVRPCPSCGKAMTLVPTAPRLGGLPELRSFQCWACGNVHTEGVPEDRPPRDPAR
jgi:hypothetical protein